MLEFFENIPMLFDAFDEKGNIIFWNKECEHVTGYKAEEIINNPNALHMLHPDKKYFNKVITEKEKKETFRDVELEIYCKDGSKKIILWSNASKMFPIPGFARWGVGYDISEQKEAKKKIMEAKQLFEIFMNNIPGSVFIKDKESKLLFANKYMFKHFVDKSAFVIIL